MFVILKTVESIKLQSIPSFVQKYRQIDTGSCVSTCPLPSVTNTGYILRANVLVESRSTGKHE
jgi:hypothetical protein